MGTRIRAWSRGRSGARTTFRCRRIRILLALHGERRAGSGSSGSRYTMRIQLRGLRVIIVVGVLECSDMRGRRCVAPDGTRLVQLGRWFLVIVAPVGILASWCVACGPALLPL